MATVRVDRWVCATRLYKSRSDAHAACSGGHVRVNGAPAKASHVLKVGDLVEAVAPRGAVVWEVTAIAGKRLSAQGAQALYADRTPAAPPKELVAEVRDRGLGRPTKADRRATDRLKRGM